MGLEKCYKRKAPFILLPMARRYCSEMLSKHRSEQAARQACSARKYLLANIEVRPQRLSVLLGKHNASGPEETEKRFRVVNVMIHPKYWENYVDRTYDIGMLKLEQPVKFNKFIRPIPLSNVASSQVESCSLAGWSEGDNGLNASYWGPNTVLRKLNFLTGKIEYDGGLHYNESKAHGVNKGDSGTAVICQAGNQTVIQGVLRKSNFDFETGLFRVYFADIYVLMSWIDGTFEHIETLRMYHEELDYYRRISFTYSCIHVGQMQSFSDLSEAELFMGNKVPTLNIIGQNDDFGPMMWNVSVTTKGSARYHCEGLLRSTNGVVYDDLDLSEECLQYFKVKESIVVTTYKIDQSTNIHSQEGAIEHSISNEVGITVAYLGWNVEFNDFVQPIALPVGRGNISMADLSLAIVAIVVRYTFEKNEMIYQIPVKIHGYETIDGVEMVTTERLYKAADTPDHLSVELGQGVLVGFEKSIRQHFVIGLNATTVQKSGHQHIERHILIERHTEWIRRTIPDIRKIYNAISD
uniref:Peptidase S1 domain-containing protein n=1 Tax=Romanomermis culicivorax TaxID=13658 RepID=A0A915I9G6_ROMCU